MELTRRHLASLLPFLTASEANAQTPQPAKPLLESKTYAFEDLPKKQNGPNSSRAVMNGSTHEAIPFEMHITELGPGLAPHPPHQHAHEEIVIVRQGGLDVTINGKTTKAGAGAVIYAASGDMHGWVSNSTGTTFYYVIALGHD